MHEQRRIHNVKIKNFKKKIQAKISRKKISLTKKKE